MYWWGWQIPDQGTLSPSFRNLSLSSLLEIKEREIKVVWSVI
jgi:hypothetical protein